MRFMGQASAKVDILWVVFKSCSVEHYYGLYVGSDWVAFSMRAWIIGTF
jgi:hypothetical protein